MIFVSTADSDETLADQAIRGSREAFEQLVRRYAAPILAFCRHLLQDGAEAEDRTQEAFTKAYQKIGQFDSSGKFASWIFKIAQNCCIDTLRARKAWEPVEDRPAPESHEPYSERLDNLERILAKLPARYRMVLHYKYRVNLTTEEIARQLDTSPENVRVCLHRAIRLIRERLAP